MDELVQGWDDSDGHHAGLDSTVRFPGLGNLWPMPIDNRLKMLSTGIKSPVGLKIMGPDLQTLAKLSEQASALLKQVPGTTDAYPERAFGGYYLDINIKRDAAARYGLTPGDVQDVISTAIGGMKISTAVEGLERYPINLRYARDLRGDPSTLAHVLVPTPTGTQIPLGELAEFQINPGPPMVRSEQLQTGDIRLCHPESRCRNLREGCGRSWKKSCNCRPVTRSPGPASLSKSRKPTPGFSGPDR